MLLSLVSLPCVIEPLARRLDGMRSGFFVRTPCYRCSTQATHQTPIPGNVELHENRATPQTSPFTRERVLV